MPIFINKSILILLVILFTSSFTFAADLKTRIARTPIVPSLDTTTYAEFIHTLNFSSLESTDVIQIAYDISEQQQPELTPLFTPTKFTISATLQPSATPLIVPAELPFHLIDGVYQAQEFSPTYLFKLKRDDEVRFLVTIIYSSLDSKLLTYENSPITLSIRIISTSTNPVDPIDNEVISTKVVFSHPAPLPQTTTFSYLDFPMHENPSASHFTLQIPPTDFTFNQIIFRPLGLWSYTNLDQPMYCHLDGVFVSQGEARDTMDEFYFFFSIPTEYNPDWTLPTTSMISIDCLFVGSVFDKQNKDDNFFGFAISFWVLEDGLSPDTSPTVLVSNKKLVPSTHHYENDEARAEIPFLYRQSQSLGFGIDLMWWRSQSTLNVPTTKTESPNFSTNITNAVAKDFKYRSIFTYLYLITASTGNPHLWSADNFESFYIESNQFPLEYDVTVADFSFSCMTDAASSNKSIEVLGRGTFDLIDSDIPRIFQSSPVSPWFNDTTSNSNTSDNKKFRCDPNLDDGMLYITIQIEHTIPFTFTDQHVPDPYPFFYLHYTQGLLFDDSSTVLPTTQIAQKHQQFQTIGPLSQEHQQEVQSSPKPPVKFPSTSLHHYDVGPTNNFTETISTVKPFERLTGNMLDSSPFLLVSDSTRFSIIAIPYSSNSDEKSPAFHNIAATAIEGLYQVANITLSSLKVSTSYLSLYLPNGEYYWGGNFEKGCFLNQTIPLRVIGFANRTTEIVFYYDFLVDQTYIITCPEPTFPLYLLPTNAPYMQTVPKFISLTKKHNISACLHTVPNGYKEGSYSAFTSILFTDDVESKGFPLWLQITLLVGAIIGLTLALVGVSIICLCCCCFEKRPVTINKSGDILPAAGENNNDTFNLNGSYLVQPADAGNATIINNNNNTNNKKTQPKQGKSLIDATTALLHENSAQ